MPSYPRRQAAAEATRSFCRIVPLQGGANVAIQALTPRLYILAVEDLSVEQVVVNREELRLLRAAIDVALEVSE